MKPLLFEPTTTMASVTLTTTSIRLTMDFKNIWKRKFSKSSVRYYANRPNTTATKRILLLSGDVEINPGWQGTTYRDTDTDYLQDFARAISCKSNKLNIAHINIRSLRNKLDEIKLKLHIGRFDIFAVTETHLDRKISNRQLEIENYKIMRRDRDAATIGGGCLVYIANHICSTRLHSLESPDIEGIALCTNDVTYF